MDRISLRLGLLLVLTASLSPAYSVLTHEAIVDSAWDQSIKPLLLARYPQATNEDVTGAHAYAYAGCILQDMGYYPFGSKFFSDLVHYVRSGDFVLNLIRESQDIDEYAFALGALAHYAADTEGHSIAVNRSVPIAYPKLERKYGNVITYAENPPAHLKVEFSFDVVQVANQDYAPQAYHDFIGFKVAKGVLERAFRDTYCLELKDAFSDLDLALGTYRYTVSSLIPEMTKVAWNIKKNDIVKRRPSMTRRVFIYNLSKASYRKEWDERHESPGAGAKVLAFMVRIMPKIGPLRTLAFKPPTPETEKLFEQSFNRTLDRYRDLLRQEPDPSFRLEEMNFDTGVETRPAEYTLADKTYAKLAIKLAAHPANVDPQVRDSVLAFFANPNLPYAVKKDPKDWQQTQKALDKLRAQTSAAMPY